MFGSFILFRLHRKWIILSFYNISKATWWNIWLHNDFVDNVFKQLSWIPSEVSDEDLKTIEKFVCTAYDGQKKFLLDEINKLCFSIFRQLPQNDLRRLPPSREALRLHISRSAYVGGWIWGSALLEHCQIPPPTNWGWKFQQNILTPVWCPDMTVKLDDFLFTCTCKTQCTRCKCFTREVGCLPYCKCSCI